MVGDMVLSTDERAWTRRLALAVILVTCTGGGAFVLIDRSRADCDIVSDMMRAYSSSQLLVDSALHGGPRGVEDQLAAADAEARTAEDLRRMSVQISSAPLRVQATLFADAAAMFAENARNDAQRPPELDPFLATLPGLDPEDVRASDTFFDAAWVMVAACPSAQPPRGGPPR
jgi:hypothetical protein